MSFWFYSLSTGKSGRELIKRNARWIDTGLEASPFTCGKIQALTSVFTIFPLSPFKVCGNVFNSWYFTFIYLVKLISWRYKNKQLQLTFFTQDWIRFMPLAKASSFQPGRTRLLAQQHRSDLDEHPAQRMHQGLSKITRKCDLWATLSLAFTPFSPNKLTLIQPLRITNRPISGHITLHSKVTLGESALNHLCSVTYVQATVESLRRRCEGSFVGAAAGLDLTGKMFVVTVHFCKWSE